MKCFILINKFIIFKHITNLNSNSFIITNKHNNFFYSKILLSLKL